MIMRGLRRSDQGFTLVELLVVLGVIGLLAVLSAPVIGRSIDKVRETRSLSNLRQIGIAQHGFANDHNGDFAYGWYYHTGDWINRPAPDGRYQTTWQDRLLPYMATSVPPDRVLADPRSPFVCPGARTHAPGGNVVTSYGINNEQLGMQWMFSSRRVPEPARIILVGSQVDWSWNDYVVPPPSGSDQSVAFRYAGGKRACFLFCDGHVESLTEAEVRGNAPRESNRWRWW